MSHNIYFYVQHAYDQHNRMQFTYCMLNTTFQERYSANGVNPLSVGLSRIWEYERLYCFGMLARYNVCIYIALLLASWHQ